MSFLLYCFTDLGLVVFVFMFILFIFVQNLPICFLPLGKSLMVATMLKVVAIFDVCSSLLLCITCSHLKVKHYIHGQVWIVLNPIHLFLFDVGVFGLQTQTVNKCVHLVISTCISDVTDDCKINLY